MEIQRFREDYVVLYELPFEKQKELFDVFMESIRDYVFKKNHPYKYKGKEQIVKILNFIAKEHNVKYNTNISFGLYRGKIKFSSKRMAYEVGLLPLIFDQFRKCYRCSEGCYND